MASNFKKEVSDEFYNAELIDPMKDTSNVLSEEKETLPRLVKISGNEKYLCIVYKKNHGGYYTYTITKPNITVRMSSNNYSIQDTLKRPVATFTDSETDCLFTIKGEKGTQYFQSFNNLEELTRFINFLNNITETMDND